MYVLRKNQQNNQPHDMMTNFFKQNHTKELEEMQTHRFAQRFQRQKRFGDTLRYLQRKQRSQKQYAIQGMNNPWLRNQINNLPENEEFCNIEIENFVSQSQDDNRKDFTFAAL